MSRILYATVLCALIFYPWPAPAEQLSLDCDLTVVGLPPIAKYTAHIDIDENGVTAIVDGVRTHYGNTNDAYINTSGRREYFSVSKSELTYGMEFVYEYMANKKSRIVINRTTGEYKSYSGSNDFDLALGVQGVCREVATK